ncbi:MAG: hypothetical protein E7187_08250 [Erysipelotrichaceae bacterium]|nr:hypothetical protein [Erysipelotrichaceae bacterium]MBR2546369.1 hypothetical protein [Erysipelotrichaceae bacterium]
MGKLICKRTVAVIILLIAFCFLTGCGQKGHDEEPSSSKTGEETEKMMKLYIDEHEMNVAWEDNQSVKALAQLASEKELRISTSMYGGFEQVGAIGQSLPRNDVQTETGPGDIVLYSGNQIVVFYGSNSWSYTRLGHILDKSEQELAALLGKDTVTLTITVE